MAGASREAVGRGQAQGGAAGDVSGGEGQPCQPGCNSAAAAAAAGAERGWILAVWLKCFKGVVETPFLLSVVLAGVSVRDGAGLLLVELITATVA